VSIRVHQPKITVYCMWNPGFWNTSFFLFFYIFFKVFSSLLYFVLVFSHCSHQGTLRVMRYVWYSAPFLKSKSFLSFHLIFYLFCFFVSYFFCGWDDFSRKTNSLINVDQQGVELKLVHTQHLEEMQGLFGMELKSKFQFNWS